MKFSVSLMGRWIQGTELQMFCLTPALKWMITELACFAYGLVVVPLYDTLGLKAMKHICNEGMFLFVSTFSLSILRQSR